MSLNKLIFEEEIIFGNFKTKQFSRNGAQAIPRRLSSYALEMHLAKRSQRVRMGRSAVVSALAGRPPRRLALATRSEIRTDRRGAVPRVRRGERCLPVGINGPAVCQLYRFKHVR